jgi:carboxypeptidase C (cathepsin A)
LEQNAKNIPGAHKINLETVSIGNGWFDPLIQYQAYYNFTVYPGNTYDITVNESVADQWYQNLWGSGNCVDKLNDCYARGWDELCSDADNFCYYNSEYLYDYYLGRDEYDSRELTPDPFPYEYYVDYLNDPKILATIGAYQNFSESSDAVYAAFTATGDDAREDGTIEAVKKLLAQGVRVTLYFGDADYICNWVGGEVIADEVGAPGYSTAGFANITTSDGVQHGQVKESGIFSFVRIYEAGHEVPFYQPLASLEMFDRIINGKDIATGKQHISPGYKTKGPKSSRWYVEGDATVQHEVLPSNATYNTETNAPNPPKPMKRSGVPSSRRLPFKPNMARYHQKRTSALKRAEDNVFRN